jgi:hypothetical protein
MTLCIQAKVDSVPQFYFPGGKPVPSEVRAAALEKIDELFRSNPDGLAVPAVRELVKEVGSLPAVMECSISISHDACTAASILCALGLIPNTLGCIIYALRIFTRYCELLSSVCSHCIVSLLAMLWSAETHRPVRHHRTASLVKYTVK